MLERKDVRFKLDPDMHTALTIVAASDSLDIGEWVEKLVASEVHRRVHTYTVAADKLRRAGISGNNGDLFGTVPVAALEPKQTRGRR